MNFDKVKFSEILIKIKNSYGSINQMAEKSEVTSAYLSKLIRLMYDNAPSPEILKKIANHSNNLTSYDELMKVCGYIENDYSNLKIELEKELYKFDLTEDEYHDAINCFMNDSKTIQGLYFVLKFSPPLEDKEIDRERKVLITIMQYVLEFIPDDLEMPNTKEVVTNKEKREEAEREFYEKFDKALRPAKKMLLSLDKDKIVHNTLNKFYMCPIYNSISAEPPHWKEENIIGYIPLDYTMYNIDNVEDCFYFKMKDNSLNKIIAKDTYILLKKQNKAKVEDIVLVSIDNAEPVIRKCMQLDKDIAIFQSLSKEGSNMDIIINKQRNYKILGKMIGQMNINN